MTLKNEHTAAIRRYKNQLEQLRTLINGEIAALIDLSPEPTCLSAIETMAHLTIATGHKLTTIATIRTNHEPSALDD